MREILAMPFGWVLSLFYNITGSYLISILVLTVIIRLLLLPVSISQQKNSAKQVRLNTKVNKIKQKYAGNQQKIQEETQALYQREGFGVSNMGCAPLAVQLIVMIGLYEVIYTPLSSVLRFSNEIVAKLQEVMNIVVNTSGKGTNTARYVEINILNGVSELKEQISSSGVLTGKQFNDLLTLKDQFSFMGLDLTQTPNVKEFNAYWLIPLLSFATAMLSAVFMYIKQKQQNPEMAKNPSMGCMTFMSPLMSLAFTFMFPAGVGVYWIISNVLSFIQQVVLTRVYSPRKVIAQQMVDETVLRRSKENNTKMRVEIEKK